MRCGLWVIIESKDLLSLNIVNFLVLIIIFILQPHAPMVQWMQVAVATKLLLQVLHFLLMELRKHAGTSITGILQTSPLSVYLQL